MKQIILSFFIALIFSFPASAADGVLNVASQFSVKETADRLEKIVKEKGMTIFNRINHSKSAIKMGIPLRDTELIIFGNPKAGSPLIQCQQSIALDLPQKALIWMDENHKVWISYNDVGYLQQRHDVAHCEKIIGKITAALSAVMKLAAEESID
ncbi:MAG: DUF302 domain-containing protein [Pseudomonadales bacterium]|nr:DUF302 domain-containing protein [Pseudomonadales bacterium]